MKATVSIVLPNSIRRTAAYHEAGHAVAALALNIPIERISILDQITVDDLSLADNLKPGDVIPTPAGIAPTFGKVSFVPSWVHALDQVIILLAGLLAEKHLALTLTDVLRMDSTDVDTLRLLIEEYELTGEMLDWTFYQAFAILAANWRSVENLAGALLETGTIDGSSLFVVMKDRPDYPSLSSRPPVELLRL